MKITEMKHFVLGDSIDHLINLDFHCKGLMRLYQAFREEVGLPLVYKAAKGLMEHLADLPAGEVVCIGTGFLIDPFLKPETDGVVAAPLVARALALSYGLAPVILCEDECLESIRWASTASELHVTDDIDVARKNKNTVCILPVSKDPAEAKVFSDAFLDRTNCRLMISIEHGGANEAGVYHSALGQDVSYKVAKLDYLFTRIQDLGGYTIGIGDLGNELGLGNAKSAIRELIPFGEVCNCPCGQGTVAAVASHAPIIGMSSEVATYGFLAMLSAMRGDPRILCTPDLQRHVLTIAAMHGAVDGQDGRCSQTIDIMRGDTVKNLVSLLHDLIEHADMHTKNRPEFIEYLVEEEAFLLKMTLK